MLEYEKAQEELFFLMKEKSEISFFLRKSRKAEFLWVSDVLKRFPDFPLESLQMLGYSYQISQGLLWIGFSQRKWEYLLDGFSCAPLSFSCSQEWLETYSLARLIVLHSNRNAFDPSMINQVYQFTAMKPQEREQTAQKLMSQNAIKLREGKPLCEVAGRLLLWFLSEKDAARR